MKPDNEEEASIFDDIELEKISATHIIVARIFLFIITIIQLYVLLSTWSHISSLEIIRQIVFIVTFSGLAFWSIDSPVRALSIAMLVCIVKYITELIIYDVDFLFTLLYIMALLIFMFGVGNALEIKNRRRK